ncbi:nuclear pore complex protein Nup205 [Ostrinia furnacalis]|uniref:nuclear pore complex protein Nup205 n=1 Tax=Ostrinia furnacalis TaxID=93504 RepID=UPI00103B2A33|nr:nuclear pore complex protein Nup205 [Ostrinia furnacalis]
MMDINEGTTTDDLWTPYKELVAVVEGYLAHESGGAPYAVHTFESVLRRHKQTFLSLLKNPAKSQSSREEIKRGITEGVNLPSIGRTLLSKELVDEAIIISDMYNVNEYLALELLHTAQRQAPRHPGLPRGLVAVLLYYDGKRALVQALKELFMARDGVCWSISAREEIVSYVSRYVGGLVAGGQLEAALDALQQCSLDAELSLLQRNRALPPPRHHARLVATIDATRYPLCILRLLDLGLLDLRLLDLRQLDLRLLELGPLDFGLLDLRQLDLRLVDLRLLVLGLLDHRLLDLRLIDLRLLDLRLVDLRQLDLRLLVLGLLDHRILVRYSVQKAEIRRHQTTSPSLGPTGALDEVSLTLQMALLYALDLSVLHRREDGEELAKKLPLIEDPELIPILLEQLSPPSQGAQPENPGTTAAGAGCRALCQLSLGLALAALKRGPQSLARAQLKLDLLDQDEVLVDAAIDGKVFEYLDEAILSTDLVWKDEYYQRRIHILITDFIVLMHSKLMEMRVKADEAARAVAMYAAEGVMAPAGASGPRTRLDALLRCVERLYARDPLGLRHEYWAAAADRPPPHRAATRAATLYKFVRLSGELVCAALLPAYLRALAALAVPVHTWALLARRDALSAHHLLTALARYYTNLRVDPTPFSEHQHSSMGATAIVTPAARPGKLLVRQEEVEAMIAALKLIAAVAIQDEAACASICENLQWDAVNVMFGLICCHVPIQLKAELCLTLGALGSTASTAPRVWCALESAQLVSPTDEKRALTADLQEVECRMEDYPLSRAFVSLLLSLCRAGGLPRALGAGTRAPGLAPYAHHVLARLALPAPHRPHADPARRWQMLSLCFELFALWLDQYEPAASDFPPAGREPDANPPPGFRLLLQLHGDSELLRLALGSLEGSLGLLERQPAMPGKVFVEESLVSILQILERALALERSLTAAASEAGRGVLIVGLSKLILADDGPSGGDRLVTCCRVLQLVNTLPAAAARATALLTRALSAPAAARHLLHAQAHRPHASDIRHGFVECLEAEEYGDEQQIADIRAAKEGVLLLLQQALPAAPPNLAHFLLGYRLDDDVSRSALNEAGVAGYPRTCLHSILDILDQHIAGQNNGDREASNLVESCYRLVYWLAARPATSAPALRFLRSRDYFLARHVKATVNLETASVVTLSARSWVLRACACEAGAAAAGRQHAALATLLAALTHAPLHHTQEWEWCLLRRTLEALPVSVEACAEPRWELFHAHQLRHAIASCDLPTGLGGKRISVSRVHALLARELSALHATAPQRNLVALEIQKVLDYVTEVNRQRNLAATLTHYYDSWRQLTEILFCVAPPDILSLESRKNLLLNILQDLLNKIPPAEVLPQLGNLASGTVLLLLVNLRHCYILQKRETNMDASEFETSFFGPSNQIMQTKSLTLKFILHKILSWILVSGGSTQKMRVNLYGALLNYLNIVNLKPSPADPEEELNTTYVSRLDSSKARPSKEESALKSMVVDVISGFGENLCSIVCSDCIGGGHDVCRMVALSCLDTLVEINPKTDWMNTLTNQGYLRSLIDSLMQDDAGLKEALEPNPKTLRVLYVYESKMALLMKLAGTRAGAETILAQGALSCLANMSILSRHPDIHTASDSQRHTDFVPAVANRFRQILVPALALCDALLTTLGTQNHSCVIHVTHLLLSHAECVDMVLRAANPNSPQELLIEAEALTSVIARASDYAVIEAVSGDTALQHSSAALQRMHSLVLALIPRFAAPPPHQYNQPPANQQQDQNILYYKIVCNLLTFARNMIEHDGTRALFRPALHASGADAGPHLGALLALLRHARDSAQAYDKRVHTAQHQLLAVPTMTLDDIKKLLPEDTPASSPAEARACAVSELRARVAERRRALALARLAADAALYLLWAHLRVFLRLAAPSDDHSLARLAADAAFAWRGAGGDELVELRKGLVGVFSDRFTDDLLDNAKNQPAAQRSFLEVLLKDIKSMIQFSPL